MNKNISQSLIIRPGELAKLLNLSRPTLWRMEKEGRLPRRKQIGGRAVGYLCSEIEEWLKSRPDVDLGEPLNDKQEKSHGKDGKMLQ